MRVLAMSLQMEIIVFIQEEHPSDGSSFPSTSTFLQSKSSWCPSLNSQGLRLRMSHIWPITHHFSHREVVWSQGSMGIISVPWPPLALHRSEGRQLHTLGNPIFSLTMDLCDHVRHFRVKCFLSSCLTRIHRRESLLERIDIIPNTLTKVPCTMKSRND